jgi:hypothetical protein
MAYGSSNTAPAPRPAWQKKLLAVPEPDRNFSQRHMADSIHLVEEAVALLRVKDSSADIKNPKTIKALCNIVEIITTNGNYGCLRYYMTRKTEIQIMNSLTGILTKLNARPLNLINPKPEISVSVCLAAILTFGLRLYGSNQPPTEETHATTTASLMHSLGLLRSIPASLKPKCTQFLKEKLGSSMEIEDVLTALECNAMAIESDVLFQGIDYLCELDKSRYLHFLKYLTTRTRKLTVHIMSTGRLCDNLLCHLSSLDYQLQRISWCYKSSIKPTEIPIDDPVHQLWFEACAIYMALLTCCLKLAEEAYIPNDDCVIATLNQLLLSAVLIGCLERVKYTDIESSCSEMKAAVDACSSWSPPFWKVTMITATRKIINEKILPFLRDTNPSTTARIDVFTPGYLELCTPNTVRVLLEEQHLKPCSACGIEALDLQKCSGVSLFYFVLFHRLFFVLV